MVEYYKYSIKSLSSLKSIKTGLLAVQSFIRSVPLGKTISWFKRSTSFCKFYIVYVDTETLIIEVILLT